MAYMKGQGATEYLVLLAVVLIIALVSIALLGFFPGMASDAKITQSNSYWRGEARPFAIIDHQINTSGAGTLILQNVEASGALTITAIVNSNTTGTSLSSTQVTFGSGETKNISISAAPTGTSGSVYDFGLVITYTSPNIAGLKQYGAKNIIGKYT